MGPLTKGISKKDISTEKVSGSLEKVTFMKEIILWTKNMDLGNTFGRMGLYMKECSLMVINQQVEIDTNDFNKKSFHFKPQALADCFFNTISSFHLSNLVFPYSPSLASSRKGSLSKYNCLLSQSIVHKETSFIFCSISRLFGKHSCF